MKDIIESVINLAFVIGLVFGTGKGLVLLHEEIKREALTTISKGLSSSEELSRSLTVSVGI